METITLSSKNYEDKNQRYGDCTIIDYNTGILIYDCGSEKHAYRVMDYIKDKNIEKVDIVLSHNDSDHFNGIPTLIEQNKVNSIYTIWASDYCRELLKKINDDRKTPKSIKEQIEEIYSNIESISKVNMLDALETTKINNEIKIVGPSKDYFLNSTSKLLDTTESDNINGDTILNDCSIQLEVNLNNNKILFTGDATFEAIKDKLQNYNIIQLPHHGREEQATLIFNEIKDNHVKYLVSDNTGSSNGGSDKLPAKGYDIENTKNGDIKLDNTIVLINCKGSYGEKHEMHNFK